MNMKPTYNEIASSFSLWSEYCDPDGHYSEEDFNTESTSEKISVLVECFGEEETQ